MINKTNKLNANQVQIKLNNLHDARIKWENGTYKASNEELYAILGDCLALLSELSAERSLIKELNNILETRGITVNRGTALATKVVRFVFDGCSKERSYAYARVLSVAQVEKPENVSMKTFINERGGIEAIRKTPKNGTQSATEKAKQNIDLAERHYATAKPLVQSFKAKAPELHPHHEAANDFAVALVRRNPDHSLSIVFGSNNQRLVSQLLAEAGKNCAAQETEQQASEEQRANRNARNNAVQSATAKAHERKAAEKLAA